MRHNYKIVFIVQVIKAKIYSRRDRKNYKSFSLNLNWMIMNKAIMMQELSLQADNSDSIHSTMMMMMLGLEISILS